MATVTRGEHAGKQVELFQWANNWFMVDTLDPQDSILSPLSVHLTPAEMDSWWARPNGMDHDYVLGADGAFRRRRLEVMR